MEMMSNAIGKLLESIWASDRYILFAVAITLGILIFTRIMSKRIKKDKAKIMERKDSMLAKRLYDWARRSYTLFVTFISIFPLLGMFGTVCGLLGLDLTAGDMENIKNNFFMALTSTAWGIIFSVIFKIVHAFYADDIEEQIEIAKKLSEETN